MAKMGFKPQERVQVKVECLRLLATFKLSKARQQLIGGFVDTYLKLNKKEALQFKQRIATLPNETERKKVMELTNSWKEEGRQEGRQEGMRQEGQQIVLRQLHRRWKGGLSPMLERRVRALTVKQLEDLAEALLDFSSPVDLENWLRRI